MYAKNDTTDRSFRFYAAELNAIPKLDLHGVRADVAREQTQRFVDDHLMSGEDAVEIIHGRGNGILRRVVHEVLQEYVDAGAIEAYADAQHANAQGGSTVVLF